MRISKIYSHLNIAMADQYIIGHSRHSQILFEIFVFLLFHKRLT